MPPLAIVAGIGAAGSLAGGAIASAGAQGAAQTQSDAAIQAAQIQAGEADKALQFQEQQYQTGQGELAPWLGAGTTALANLEQGLGLPVQGNATLPGAGPQAARPAAGARGNFVGGYNTGGLDRFSNGPFNSRMDMAGLRGGGYNPGGFTGQVPQGTPSGVAPTHQVPLSSLLSPGMKAGALNFQPPTGLTMQNDPGYQARLQLGQQAIENSAAARGDLLTGGEGRALTDYAQNFASNEYSNVYNRALTNNMTAYNRLASLAGLGQQTATSGVGAGNQSANSIANTLMSLGELQGQAYNNIGAARAAGTVGSSNAWGGALGNLSGYASLIPLLQMMQQNNSIPSMDPNAAAQALGG